MGNLSEHLSRHEFACKCGCGFEAADVELVSGLEDVARHFYDEVLRESILKPSVERPERIRIHINSADRCQAYDLSLKLEIAEKEGRIFVPNEKISEHVNGLASDFWLDFVMADGNKIKINDDEIANYLESRHVARGGIGRYDRRTHFDVRSRGLARWDKRSKKVSTR